jgi:Bax protein
MVRDASETRRRRWPGPALAGGLVVLAFTGPVDADTGRPPLGRDATFRLYEARAASPFAGAPVVALSAHQRPRWYPTGYDRAAAALPDFTTMTDVERKKREFFAWMLPLIERENRRLAELRRRLSCIFDHVRWDHAMAPEDRAWLNDVADEFRIEDPDPHRTDFWQKAFQRIDTLPPDLVAVQAATESGWGTSRFAREGNNLFGQWCFRPGCGIVPHGRPDGETYEVARFESPEESVASYMRNLNTGHSYQLLREIRARQRSEGRTPDGAELAAGLTDYSERGLEYVDEIRAMLRRIDRRAPPDAFPARCPRRRAHPGSRRRHGHDDPVARFGRGGFPGRAAA